MCSCRDSVDRDGVCQNTKVGNLRAEDDALQVPLTRILSTSTVITPGDARPDLCLVKIGAKGNAIA